MNFFFDNLVYRGLSDAARQSSRTESKAENTEIKVAELQRRIDYLEDWIDHIAIGMTALTELLEEHGVTHDAMQTRIQEIDLRDGVADGKITRQRTNCPQCGQENHRRRTNCLYCGHSLVIQNI